MSDETEMSPEDLAAAERITMGAEGTLMLLDVFTPEGDLATSSSILSMAVAQFFKQSADQHGADKAIKLFDAWARITREAVLERLGLPVPSETEPTQSIKPVDMKDVWKTQDGILLATTVEGGGCKCGRFYVRLRDTKGEMFAAAVMPKRTAETLSSEILDALNGNDLHECSDAHGSDIKH